MTRSVAAPAVADVLPKQPENSAGVGSGRHPFLRTIPKGSALAVSIITLTALFTETMLAEFLEPGTRIAPDTWTDPNLDSGMSAMGKPIPFYRQQVGYEHCLSMGLTRQNAHSAVSAVSEQLARDKPYEAMAAGMRFLDLTGTYRLFAVLLTAEKPAGDEPQFVGFDE